MREQIFTVKVTTNEKDGCGEKIPAITAGQIRQALLEELDDYDSITVSDFFDADI